MAEDVASVAPDQKVICEQRCEDFHSLNGFLWQPPLIIMSLTGGLWFAVASFAFRDTARTMLLIFAGAADVLMTGALIRLCYVMQSVLADMPVRCWKPGGTTPTTSSPARAAGTEPRPKWGRAQSANGIGGHAPNTVVAITPSDGHHNSPWLYS